MQGSLISFCNQDFMKSFDDLLYTLVVHSNLYLKGNSPDLTHLNQRITNHTNSYPMYFQELPAHNFNFVYQWFEYLAYENCLQVLILSKKGVLKVRVIKEGGLADLWEFKEEKYEEGIRYVFAKGKRVGKGKVQQSKLEVVKYQARCLQYFKALDELMIDEKGHRACNYFEDRLNIFSKQEVQGYILPLSFDFPIGLRQLVRIYECSGDFNSFRSWNPFYLGDEREQKAGKLYDDYRKMSKEMMKDIVNGIVNI